MEFSLYLNDFTLDFVEVWCLSLIYLSLYLFLGIF
jgi:hypothetical protein